MSRIAAVLAALLLCACGRARPKTAGGEPLQRLFGLTMSQTYRGEKVWDMTADEAVLADQETRATVSNPRMTFHRGGRPSSTLSAATGVVGLQSRDVVLSTSVVVTSLDDKSVLRTQQLKFLSERKRFFTDKEVLVRRPGAVLRGSGLEATPDLSEIRVFNQRSVIEEKAVPR